MYILEPLIRRARSDFRFARKCNFEIHLEEMCSSNCQPQITKITKNHKNYIFQIIYKMSHTDEQNAPPKNLKLSLKRGLKYCIFLGYSTVWVTRDWILNEKMPWAKGERCRRPPMRRRSRSAHVREKIVFPFEIASLVLQTVLTISYDKRYILMRFIPGKTSFNDKSM